MTDRILLPGASPTPAAGPPSAGPMPPSAGPLDAMTAGAAAPSAIPDIRAALPWRAVADALQEADDRCRPILCLLEPHWSNGAQRLALVLGEDDEARTLAAEAFVPLLVDPVEHPNVAARMRWAAATLGGSVGPPLLLLLTHEGQPFLSYCSLWPEGRDPYPSLRSLLASVDALYRDRRREVVAEARELRRRARGGAATAPAYTAWQGVRDAVDERFGGLDEIPKLPRAPLLWRLLDEAWHAPVAEHLARTLDAMVRGGVRDQLDGSFHRCARDERWVVPHFEKLVPQNAALAAVYARAARTLDRPDYLGVADAAAAFAVRGLQSGVMVVAADAPAYTWTPAEFRDALADPALIQAMGLHVRMSRDDSKHVLYQAMQPDEMLGHADEDAATLADRVEAGRARLSLARAQRPAPETIDVAAPSWRAETLKWLFRAGRSGARVDAGHLRSDLESLLARPFDPERGYARDHGPVRGRRWWLEDQVALLGAALASASGSPLAADAAAALGTLVTSAYQDRDTGALTDRPGDGRRQNASLDLVDGCTSAAVPAAIEALGQLAETVGGRDGARFERAARAAEAFHRDPAHAASGGLERPPALPRRHAPATTAVGGVSRPSAAGRRARPPARPRCEGPSGGGH